jgi:hypothetical protein
MWSTSSVIAHEQGSIAERILRYGIAPDPIKEKAEFRVGMCIAIIDHKTDVADNGSNRPWIPHRLWRILGPVAVMDAVVPSLNHIP